MSIFKRGGRESEDIEGEVPKFVRREVAVRANDDEVLAHNVGSLLQRVSVNSVQEIDRLIGDLRGLKQRLEHEGERIQREIGEYASMSQAAMHSTRVIAESLTHLRKNADAPATSE